MLSSRSERRKWLQKILSLQAGDDASFLQLTFDLYRWQRRANRTYRDLLRRTDADYRVGDPLSSLPPVFATLFKQCRVACHGKATDSLLFLSSGTTGAARSQHALLDDTLYRGVSTAAVPFFAPNGPARIEMHFLTASPREAPHSSLARMFFFWRKTFGADHSDFWVKKDEILATRLRVVLERARIEGRPVGILGPAFGFAHLWDAWKHQPLSFPAGSFVMETGGFKGRTREIPRPDFYRKIGKLFGLKDDRIWNEYGMTELCSQAYSRGVSGEHVAPPWTRVLLIDPVTNLEVEVGRRGLVRWIDLANVDSVLALQTQDVAVRTARGFRLLGRLPRLPRRGCSLTVEELAVL